MNNIVDKVESKIKDYKKEKDYKFIANQEKKVFIITNKELKEVCWEFFYQIVSEKFVLKNNLPFICYENGWEEDELTIQIGETTKEKKEREEKEIQQEVEAGTKENQEMQQTNQSISSNSQSQIINILPWIIEGTVILIGMLFVYLFTKKENK